MTHILIDRELAQQVLESFQFFAVCYGHSRDSRDCINALQAALIAQRERVDLLAHQCWPLVDGHLLYTAQPAQPASERCIGKDPLCPCQDGDACHYKDVGDTKAWPVPPAND